MVKRRKTSVVTPNDNDPVNFSISPTRGDVLETGADLLPDTLPDGADRVSDVLQKELAASKVGLTRELYVGKIRELLTATISETVYDDMGNPSTIEKVDKMAVAKGAELAGKYFGDLKEVGKTVSGPVYNTVVYRWSSGPVVPLPTEGGALPTGGVR